MLSLDEARARVLAALSDTAQWPVETVPLHKACGRVLSEDIRARVNVPSWDNAGMDGFAVRSVDVAAPGVRLPISHRIAAGQVGSALQAHTAARIFTGAPLPSGADAVVMQEHCDWTNEQVQINAPVRSGQAIRRCAEDVAEGAVVLSRGARLTPQALGLAASVGVAQLPVAQRPRVLLLSTGDELTPPGEPLRAGSIYNANRDMLRAQLESFGAVCTDGGSVPDQLEATRRALRNAAEDHDLIISSGGVSVGDEDHLRAALMAEGHLDHWQIAIKPGKPLAFGRVSRVSGGSAWFIGLPGNPVSSFVTCLLMVYPFLKRLQGAIELYPSPIRLSAGFEWPRPDSRREFLRVRRQGDSLVLFPNQGSAVLSSVVWADGVVDNPPGNAIRTGDLVDYLPLQAWGMA